LLLTTNDPPGSLDDLIGPPSSVLRHSALFLT
jgi:hypothetical protein